MSPEEILALVVFIIVTALIGWIFGFTGGRSKSAQNKNIQLADLLAATRSELIKSHNKAVKSGLAIMKFEEIEFEFAVEIENEGSTGLKISLLEFGGRGKRKEANIVRVKYKSLPSPGIFAPQTGNEEEGPILSKQTGEK